MQAAENICLRKIAALQPVKLMLNHMYPEYPRQIVMDNLKEKELGENFHRVEKPENPKKKSIVFSVTVAVSLSLSPLPRPKLGERIFRILFYCVFGSSHTGGGWRCFIFFLFGRLPQSVGIRPRSSAKLAGSRRDSCVYSELLPVDSFHLFSCN